MATQNTKSHKDRVTRFFTGTGTTYDLIVKLCTYGADVYWKKRILSKIPKSKKILDLACGTGILTFKLEKLNPCSKVVGVDVMLEYLEQATKKWHKKNACDVHFICGKAQEVTLREKFDCITSSYIPKYVAAAELLKNITPNLKENGVLVLHDFACPANPIYRMIWRAHMFLLKIFGPLFFPQWKTVFQELSELVRTTQWIPEYLEALPQFGFQDIEVEKLTAGSAAIISAVKGGKNVGRGA